MLKINWNWSIKTVENKEADTEEISSPRFIDESKIVLLATMTLQASPVGNLLDPCWRK